MRKIEEQMVQAIRAGKCKKMDNTVVNVTGETTQVYLYGHRIAFLDNGKLSFNLCGWNTPTTRSRVNALLSAFGPVNAHVCTVKGEPYYLNGQITDGITSTQWVKA